MKRSSGMQWFTVGFLMVVSLAVRLSVVSSATFPINDGGLFHAFTADLLANNLRLPVLSSYNGAGIPLVYPPLGFYLTAAIHLATKISLLDLLQYLPAIVSAAAIPGFFALATLILPSSRQAVLATLVFSVLPRTFDWLIMGGGITRSFGLLFCLLFLGSAARLFKRGERGALAPAILTGALLVVSHPEATVHAALTAALLLAWHARNREGMLRGLLVILGIAAVSSPWWLAVILRHGLDPWLAGLSAAHQDSYSPLLSLVALLRFDFTDEPFLRLFAVLGLLGLAVQLARREYFPTAWLLLLQLVEPRGGALFMMMPLAMSAGFFLDAVLIPSLQRGQGRDRSAAAPATTTNPMRAVFGASAPTMLLAFLFLYGTVMAYFAGARLVQEATLEPRDEAALTWVSDHTSADDRFALVTEGEPLLDATSDWFPAITGRRSIASFFGAEWIPNLDFEQGLSRYRALQACADKQPQCIEDWMRSGTESADYVYVRAPEAQAQTVLQESLRLDGDFRMVYSANGVQLFEWSPQEAH